MSLLVDLGNTRLKCARLGEAGVATQVQAFAHGDAGFDAQLHAWIAQIGQSAMPVWLASVAAPDLTEHVRACFERAGHDVHRVAVVAETPTLRVGYAQPQRLGVDRWLGMLAARAEAASPVVVASVGSALTVDAVDAGGQHLGGLIAPTPDAMREALFARAPHLRGAPGTVQPLARSTEDAVASGAVLAAAALVERTWRDLAAAAAGVPRLLVTGGGGEALLPWLPAPLHRPQLVLDGLAQVAREARFR